MLRTGLAPVLGLGAALAITWPTKGILSECQARSRESRRAMAIELSSPSLLSPGRIFRLQFWLGHLLRSSFHKGLAASNMARSLGAVSGALFAGARFQRQAQKLPQGSWNGTKILLPRLLWHGTRGHRFCRVESQTWPEAALSEALSSLESNSGIVSIAVHVCAGRDIHATVVPQALVLQCRLLR